MGRRKKEAPEVHREAISRAAERLFSAKGMAAATMDDIAKEAGYSKATLYVYFESKEEIIGLLALKSMEKLYDSLRDALGEPGAVREKYHRICRALTRYQEEFPFYFQMALGEINIDFSRPDALAEDRESFRVGEKINGLLREFLRDGIAAGELRPDLKVMPTLFSFWGMLSGLIQMAASKEKYIQQELNHSKQEFLSFGFDTLYCSIAVGREEHA